MTNIAADLRYAARSLLKAPSFALVGVLTLALGIGLYGATAYSVRQRRFELGVRTALGATRGSVIRLILRRVATLVALGLIAGGLTSVFASRYIGALLYGLPLRDPLTIATAAMTMALFAGAAGWLPARRAARTNLAAVLRQG